MSAKLLLIKSITLLLATCLAFLIVYLQYTGNPLSVKIEDLVLQLGPFFDIIISMSDVPAKVQP